MFAALVWFGYIQVCVIVCVCAAGRTGWAWQTLAMSSQEAPYSMAKAASLIISPAPCRGKAKTTFNTYV